MRAPSTNTGFLLVPVLALVERLARLLLAAAALAAREDTTVADRAARIVALAAGCIMATRLWRERDNLKAAKKDARGARRDVRNTDRDPRFWGGHAWYHIRWVCSVVNVLAARMPPDHHATDHRETDHLACRERGARAHLAG